MQPPLPACPRCGQPVYVWTVPNFYATQRRTTSSVTAMPNGSGGAAPVITSSTTLTQVGRQLAPPRTRGAVLGCLGAGLAVLLAFFTVMGWILVFVPGEVRGDYPGAITITVIAVLVWFAAFGITRLVRRLRQPPGAPEPRVHQRAARYAWNSAFLCQRCPGAFFPPGALPAELAQDGLIPFPEFRGAVSAAGYRLAQLDPNRFGAGR